MVLMVIVRGLSNCRGWLTKGEIWKRRIARQDYGVLRGFNNHVIVDYSHGAPRLEDRGMEFFLLAASAIYWDILLSRIDFTVPRQNFMLRKKLRMGPVMSHPELLRSFLIYRLSEVLTPFT